MKRIIAALVLIGITTTVISLTPNQEKEYKVSMTVNEWNVILVSVSSPDDVTANQKKFVLTKLTNQINGQIRTEDSLLKIKAVQDSIKNKKQ